MINFKLPIWQAVLIILALMAVIFILGLRNGILKERWRQEAAARIEDQNNYNALAEARMAERELDSLRLDVILSINASTIENIEQIRSTYEKRYFKTGSMLVDSLLLDWASAQSRFDSIGQHYSTP